MKAKLTTRTVNALTPQERPYEVRDTELKGFLFRVQPSGAMAYYLAYDTKEGRRARYRIGGHGNLTPVQARDVAIQLFADVAHGKNIQARKKAARCEGQQAKLKTLGGFLDHKYIPWVETDHKSSGKTLSPIKANFDWLMDKPLADITPWLVEKWRTEQRKEGKAATAINRSVAALRACIGKAVHWTLLDTHPLAKLRPLKVDTHGVVRSLSEDEEQRLRAALDAREARIRAERASANEWRRQRGYAPLTTLWDHECADHLKPMSLLSLNTGLRRGEVFKLSWVNVNFHAKTLTVEGSTAKSGKTRHVPLNTEALEVLRKWKAQGKGTGPVGSPRFSLGQAVISDQLIEAPEGREQVRQS